MSYEFEKTYEFCYDDDTYGLYKIVLTVDRNLEYDGEYEGIMLCTGDEEKPATWEQIKPFVQEPATIDDAFASLYNDITDTIGTDFDEDGQRDKYW